MTAEHAIAVLNEINELDPVALLALMQFRAPCNQALANHATVQVGGTGCGYDVGILGIINGIFGISPSGWGRIAAVVVADEDGDITSVTSFVKTPVADG